MSMTHDEVKKYIRYESQEPRAQALVEQLLADRPPETLTRDWAERVRTSIREFRNEPGVRGVRRAIADSGGHFLDPNDMRAYNARVGVRTYGSRYITSSTRYDDYTPRTYRVVAVDLDGEISYVGGQLDSSERAVAAAWALAELEPAHQAVVEGLATDDFTPEAALKLYQAGAADLAPETRLGMLEALEAQGLNPETANVKQIHEAIAKANPAPDVQHSGMFAMEDDLTWEPPTLNSGTAPTRLQIAPSL